MTVLIERDPLIRKAHESFVRCTHDSEAREIALAREKYQRDKLSGLRAAEQKGKLEGKLEDARKMKAEGLSVELIARITELTLEQIAGL